MRDRKSCSGRPLGRGIRSYLTLSIVVVAAAILGPIVPGRADGLVIQAPDIPATPGSSGSFDVLLINDGSSSQDIAGDSLVMTLSGSAGSSIQFTDATIGTLAAPYIFTYSLDNDMGFPLYTNPLPDVVLMTSDSGDPMSGYPGFTTVNPGDTFGLANVSYTVSPGATLGSTDAITFDLTNNATSLSDPNLGGIAFTAVNGSINVVPEPTTLTLGTIAALMGLRAFGWRRRVDRQRLRQPSLAMT